MRTHTEKLDQIGMLHLNTQDIEAGHQNTSNVLIQASDMKSEVEQQGRMRTKNSKCKREAILAS